jgi:hypothetical protein
MRDFRYWDRTELFFRVADENGFFLNELINGSICLSHSQQGIEFFDTEYAPIT